MEISRRSFLSGTLMVTALSIVPVAITLALPRIIGDGLHDDTAGLQAAFNGEPFDCEEFVVKHPNMIQMSGGTFRVTRPLEIGSNRQIYVSECVFKHESEDMTTLHFTGPGSWWSGPVREAKERWSRDHAHI